MRRDFYLGGDWLVQPSQSRISGPNKTQRIPQKYMQVLLCLAERQGETVSRDHLMESVWQQTIVVEESLTRAISELRKIFGDDPKDSRFIETIPKIGYRLIVPVTKHPDAPGRAVRKPVLTARLYVPVATALTAACLIIWAYLSRNASTARPETRTVPLTSYRGMESQPALSPDGNSLAFVWDTGKGSNPDLYVKVFDSEQPVRLTRTSGSVSDPVWSHDSQRIAFIKHSGEGCTIFTLSPLGGPERKLLELTKRAHPLDPAWSPDAKWLAYALQDYSSARSSLYLLSLETYRSTKLTGQGSPAANDRKPAFSPDAKLLAFLRDAAGKTDIYVMPINGGQARPITRGKHRITDLDWTPDGRHLVFSVPDGLWRIPVTGGSAKLIAAGASNFHHISAARNQWRLAYEQASDEKNIWQIHISGAGGDSSRPSRLIGSTRSDADPAVAADGKRVAFVSDRSGHSQIWVCDRDGSNPIQLTHFKGCRITHPNWSPDNKRIAFSAAPAGHLDIYVIPAAGGEAIQLTRYTSNEIFPAWSRDGRWIYFGSDRTGEWQIYKVAIEDRKIVQVTTKGGYEAMESPHGSLLYYATSRNDTTEIRSLALAGGADALVFSPGTRSREDWEVGDSGIYYGYYDAQCRLNIGFFDFTTGRTKTLFRTDRSSFDFAVTPDEQTLLYDQFDRNESDIVLLDNY